MALKPSDAKCGPIRSVLYSLIKQFCSLNSQVTCLSDQVLQMASGFLDDSICTLIQCKITDGTIVLPTVTNLDSIISDGSGGYVITLTDSDGNITTETICQCPVSGVIITQKTVTIPAGTCEVDMSTATGIPAGAVLQPVCTSGDTSNQIGIRACEGNLVKFDAESTTNILNFNCLVDQAITECSTTPATSIFQHSVTIPAGTCEVDMSTVSGVPIGSILQPVCTSGDTSNQIGIRACEGNLVKFDADSTTNILHFNSII